MTERDPDAGRNPGLLASLQRLMATLLELLQTRVEIIATEFEEERVRLRELQESADAIGYDVVHMLGYHDSGMPDTDVNERPDNFANAPLDEAVGRLVAIIRDERPQVIVTYADDREFYPHPDHIRVVFLPHEEELTEAISRMSRFLDRRRAHR